MPKLKTHKATTKRFRITKQNKIIKKTAGQDHCNARESGNVTRNKRRKNQLTQNRQKKTIKNLIN